jgi:PAS domain S-box-containing protein
VAERPRNKQEPWLGGDIEQALDSIGVPAWVIDDQARLRWENAKARELFGDVRGRTVASLVAPSEQQRVRVEVARKLVGGAERSDYHTILQLASGAELPVEIHSVPLEDGMSVVGIFGVAEIEVAPAGPASDNPLTPRQHEVLRMLATGCSTAQIAEALTLSETTVRNHVAGLLRALGVHSRLEAVVEGRRRGLVE